jgi:hypothetical protein
VAAGLEKTAAGLDRGAAGEYGWNMALPPQSRQARHACARCGQVFILHYLIRVEEGVVVETRVPCVGEGCPETVLVSYPQTAYAVWVEEF